MGEIGELNQQIASVGAQLQGTIAQTSSIQNQLGVDFNRAVATSQLSNSPVVESLLEQLTLTESELAKERQRFNDEHPTIISLEAKKVALNQQLEQLIAQNVGQGVKISQGLLKNDGLKENPLEKFITLKIEELSLQRQVSALSNSQQAYLKRAKELPRLEKREQELLRQAQSASKTLTSLLDNLESTKLAETQQSSNAEIVENASVPDRGSSGKTALLALGIFLGAFLANLSVMLLEMQDRTLQTVAEIKKKFSYKVLGITPIESPIYQGRVVSREEPDSYSGEIYRMIQANLKFLTNDKPPKVILMTSSVPEEGKSTVSANLAAAISQLGRTVLLIDGDLRRPSQHRLWSIFNQFGIQDVLRGSKTLAETVSKPMAKLNVLPSSEVGSNPLALLDSPAMANLVATARREYDVVLIDAPPLPVTADVLTLSKLVDGIVFVTRPGIVEHESAALAQETLETTGQKVLGMVVNGAKASDFDRYSYQARYGKRYYQQNSSGNTIGSEELENIANDGNSTNGRTSKARI